MKEVIIYTGSYPYGATTESFIGPEMIIASRSKEYKITIVPIVKDRTIRNVPQGIAVDNCICDANALYKFKAILLIFFSQLSIRLICEDIKFLTRAKYIYHLLKYMYASNLVYFDVRRRAEHCEKMSFYSYWMSYVPIAFGRYKIQHPDTKHIFVTRGHGGDVYTTDRGLYYPFRRFVLNYIDHVYVVSQYGSCYLKQKYPEFEDKISHSYLGVLPICFKGKKDETIFKVVSCSSVYDFKRVDLLFRSLETFADAHQDVMLEWTHIGGGYNFELLKEEVENRHLAHNLSISLLGSLDNSEILKKYESQGYHVFIHLSTTEGLPVSMMEAISASIPIIATAVGGVPEIVTKETGQLLDIDFSQNDFDNALIEVLFNNEKYSMSAQVFYNENFNALHNYPMFYKSIVC